MTAPVSAFGQMAKATDITQGGLKGTTGALAKVPWFDMPIITALSGSGALGNGRADSQDGGLGYENVTCMAAGPPHGAAFGTVAKATQIGFRYRSRVLASQAPASFIVNGRCVEATPHSVPTINGLTTGSWANNEESYVFPWLLKPIDHTIYVRVDSNPDGTTVNQMGVTGWLFSRADGYRDVAPATRKGFGAATVFFGGTALQGIISEAVGSYEIAQAAKRLSFKNTDSAPHTVTLYWQDGTTVYDLIVVPAGAGVTAAAYHYDLPFPMSLSGWRWKADAGGFITGWPECQ
jgi:hypothetical protein